MSINKFLFYLLLSGSILSCNNKKDSIETPEIINPKTESAREYIFVKIEFIKKGDDIVQYNDLPKIEYLNSTKTTQTFPYDPVDGTYEVSQFTGIDSSVVNQIVHPPLIAVPISTNNSLSLGETKWPISISIEKQKSDLTYLRVFAIESNTRMTIESKLYFKYISAYVKLTLLDVKENKEQVFEGEWEGVYPIYTEFNTIVPDL